MQRPCAGRDCGEATSLVDRGSRRSQGYGGDRNAGTVPGTEHGKKTAGFPCLRCLLLGLPPRTFREDSAGPALCSSCACGWLDGGWSPTVTYLFRASSTVAQKEAAPRLLTSSHPTT
jgi:hypothetical protein